MWLKDYVAFNKNENYVSTYTIPIYHEYIFCAINMMIKKDAIYLDLDSRPLG